MFALRNKDLVTGMSYDTLAPPVVTGKSAVPSLPFQYYVLKLSFSRPFQKVARQSRQSV